MPRRTATRRRWSTALVSALALNAVTACRPHDNPGTQPPMPAPSAAPAAPHDYTQSIPGTDVSFEMVAIPGGTFTMGSPAAEKHRDDDEGPQIQVAVEPFYMGKYEVTWELFNEFLGGWSDAVHRRQLAGLERRPSLADAVTYPTPIWDITVQPKLQQLGGREGRLPAVLISPLAAKQFTKWLSAKTGRFYRLPTEAEWEYAARAGTTTAYFFGDDRRQLDDYAWYYDNAELPNGDDGYRRVGLKKPNPFGLYDIYGNVSEIVLDQYEASAYQPFEQGVHDWRHVTQWPSQQYPRVVRGGSFESDPEDLRSAARQRITVTVNAKDPEAPKSPWWWMDGGLSIGFRVVSPVTTPSQAEQHRFWDADSDAEVGILDRDREVRQPMDELRPKSSTLPTRPVAK